MHCIGMEDLTIDLDSEKHRTEMTSASPRKKPNYSLPVRPALRCVELSLVNDHDLYLNSNIWNKTSFKMIHYCMTPGDFGKM